MEFYKILSQFYFSDILMTIITLMAFIIAIKRYRDSEDLKIITYYLGVFVLQNFIGIYSELITGNISVEQVSSRIFVIIEFSIFCIYLHRSISSHKMRATIKYFYWTFVASALWDFMKHPVAGGNEIVYVMEALYLVIPCLVYFYELFIIPGLASLRNHSSFWIISGILFYNTCTLPIFLLDHYFQKRAPLYSNAVFALNYILYSLLCVLFIRAYLCKKKNDYKKKIVITIAL